MKPLVEALKGNFTAVNLGCIGDVDFLLPKHIAAALTLVEVDAEGGAVTKADYHRKITIQEPLSGSPGKRRFRRNTFPGTCSLLEPLDGIVADYGMERYCQLVERIDLDCKTLPDVLRARDIKGIDFLKTDLEGIDFEIIKSCKDYLGKILCLQCEARFKPFYQNEPYFHEVVNYLVGHGYEVLDILHIDRWNYKTPHRHFQVEGRAVWADFLFVLQPERLSSAFTDRLDEAVAKQIILTCMLGKRNYGDFLLQRFKSSLPAAWIPALDDLTKPRFPGIKRSLMALRRMLRPVELLLKHEIGRSQHVSIR